MSSRTDHESPEEVMGRAVGLLRRLAEGEPLDPVEVAEMSRRLGEARAEVKALRSERRR